ncbi:MAG: hypothetical protein RL685_978 [Pseudomonadota bacterium]|jgi:hypothetical protein
MKTQLSFYLIAAVAGALACSDEGGTDRNNGGNGGTGPVGAAGSGTGQAGSSQGAAGSSTGSGGSGGATSTGANTGPAFTITGSGADVVVQDTAGTTGITGGIVLAQSATMSTPAEITVHEGQLCMKGVTAVVPDGSSYGTHWGAELSLDLNRAAVPGAGVADAGAGDAGDAGGGDVLGTVAEPWPVGNVIGFSYKITGNDPLITADQGVSASAFRFKAVPQGADTAIDTYCSTRAPLNNAIENVLFSNIQFECWQQMPPNPSLADAMIAYNVGAQGMPSTRVNPRELLSISWQIPADLMIQHPFDFCISELRPILAP